MSGIIGRLQSKFKSVLVTPETTPLCTTCAGLDLKKILHDGVPEAKMVSLGSLRDITSKSGDCVFCRLVVDLIRRRWRLDDFPDADVQGTNFSMSAHACGTLIPDMDENKRAHRLFIHASRPLDITVALMAAKAALHLDIQLLEEDSRKVARPKDLHGRRVEDNVDVRLIKRWMKLCEGAHGSACDVVWWKSGDEDLPECVRMVDVVQMALVSAGQNCRFVALSYVWGGPGDDYWTTTANAAARGRPSGLEESVLPATIVDAIQVARLIGERYLWVDALCIIQDSQEDKAAQISVMDRIYGRAALTIVAAAGGSARAGLAGVRTGSRKVNQHVECVQGLHFAIPLPPLVEAATESTWDMRGWTFQEALLSRRRLYFTKHQVYFHCEQDVWCEDLVAESKTLPGSSNPMRYSALELASIVPYQTVGMNVRAYEEAIDQYSRRKLTVDSDIIPAMTALTNAMTRALEPPGSNPDAAFRFGVWMRNLEVSLLWQPRLDAIHVRRTAPGATRSPQPSWAWSGWKGAIHYGIESHILDGTESDPHGDPAESLVSAWHLVDEHGVVVRLDVRRIPPSWTVNDADSGRAPYTYTATADRPDDSGPVLDVAPPPGTLVFRTRCGRFRVLKLDVSPSESAAHAVFGVVPVDGSPHQAGRVILPISTPSSSVFEFIVLSRCDGLAGLWDEGRWGKRYYGCLLHVMAVQGMRGDSRVSERVGLGVIVESAWIGEGPVERVVLLA